MTSLSAAPAAITTERFTPGAEALVFRGPDRPFEMISVPEVSLGEGELLVELELTTIAPADYELVHGHGRVPVPLVLGHEQVGRIVAIGPGRAPRAADRTSVSLGDRVVWARSIACAHCPPCRRGISEHCDRLLAYGRQRMRRGWELSGGYATHVHLQPGTVIVKVADELPAAALAPLSGPTAMAIAALEAAERLRPVEGEIVAIAGCGLRGLTAVAAAAERGALVVAIDPDVERRALARELGAAAACLPGEEALAAALRPLRGRRRGRAGIAASVDFSGAAPTVDAAIAASAPGAQLVLAESPAARRHTRVGAEQLVRDQLTVTGINGYRAEHLLDAARFMDHGTAARFAPLVVDVIPLSRAGEELRDPSDAGVRVGIDPRRGR